jgi:hypothetical protein
MSARGCAPAAGGAGTGFGGSTSLSGAVAFAVGLTIVAPAASGLATSAAFAGVTIFAGAFASFTGAAFFGRAVLDTTGLEGFSALRAAGFATAGFTAALRAGAFAAFAFTAVLVFAFAKCVLSLQSARSITHKRGCNMISRKNKRCRNGNLRA